MNAHTIRMPLFVLGFLYLSACMSNTHAGPQHGDIGSSAELTAAVTPADIRAAQIRLDPAKVPVGLRSLTPLAQQWGIADDAVRDAMQAQSSEGQKAAFADKVIPHLKEIDAWLNSLPDDGQMSDEAAAFMFMQSALTEMDLYPMEPHDG